MERLTSRNSFGQKTDWSREVSLKELQNDIYKVGEQVQQLAKLLEESLDLQMMEEEL